MKVCVVSCACLVASLLLQQDVDASPRRVTSATTLRKKPGEKEPAVAELAVGTVVEVLGEQGRWLRVRFGKAEGFITRTTVSEPDPPVPAAREGAGAGGEGKSSSRGWSAARRRAEGGGEGASLLAEVASATAVLRAEPSDRSASVAELARGAHLAVLDATDVPGWANVRDDQGRTGWIARAALVNSVASVVESTGESAARSASSADGHDDAAPRGGYVRRARPPLLLRADLGLGYRAVAMELSSNASGGLSNYLVDADAAALTLNADAELRVSARLFAAADARLQVSSSSPGIEYPGPTSAPGKIPFRTFAAVANVRAGVRAQSGLALAVRVGARYDAFLPEDVENVGMLPRERLAGATVGLHAELVPARSRFGAALRFDALLLGGRQQTPGLEDGASSTARAFWGGLTLRYELSSHLAMFVGYDFERATTRWSGTSVRQAGVTGTRREDTAQLAQLGVTAAL
ncbi:MAG: SH3 domain-containing protein [Myxococcales bacterium]|nr:SH3 domain-containing protein [Myxococcales bacterium]